MTTRAKADLKVGLYVMALIAIVVVLITSVAAALDRRGRPSGRPATTRTAGHRPSLPARKSRSARKP